MTNPKFQLTKDAQGEFRFLLRARNGEPILHASEGYNSKQGALNGIASVRVHSQSEYNYFKAKTSHGQHRFGLRAVNGRTLGVSEYYTTAANRDKGIASVKKNAPTSPVEDLTLSNR